VNLPVSKILEQHGDQEWCLHDANATGGQTAEDVPGSGW